MGHFSYGCTYLSCKKLHLMCVGFEPCPFKNIQFLYIWIRIKWSTHAGIVWNYNILFWKRDWILLNGRHQSFVWYDILTLNYFDNLSINEYRILLWTFPCDKICEVFLKHCDKTLYITNSMFTFKLFQQYHPLLQHYLRFSITHK